MLITKYKIRCDMDGVIADFARGVIKIMPDFVEGVTEGNKKLDGKMWAKITQYQKNGGEFWLDLEPMADAFVLWDFISQFQDRQILSACGQPHFNAADQKRRWIAKTFGEDVQAILVQRAVHKANYAAPDTILIDDKRKAIDPWVAAGGIGILHTSAENTIAQIKQLLDVQT